MARVETGGVFGFWRILTGKDRWWEGVMRRFRQFNLKALQMVIILVGGEELERHIQFCVASTTNFIMVKESIDKNTDCGRRHICNGRQDDMRAMAQPLRVTLDIVIDGKLISRRAKRFGVARQTRQAYYLFADDPIPDYPNAQVLAV